jgi:capsular polysaccharide biosynthesis protein
MPLRAKRAAPAPQPSPVPAPPVPASAPADRGALAWRASGLALAGALLVAAATFVISHQLTPSYSSTGTVRVVASAGNGLSRDSVEGSNELATQYAQLVSGAPVLRAAERRLRVPAGTLDDKISGGTVASTNLISVDAHADGPKTAERYAKAATAAFVDVEQRFSTEQSSRYVANVKAGLRPIDRLVAQARDAVDQARTASGRASAEATLSTLLAQQQTVNSQLVLSAASSQPIVTISSDPSSASKTSPKPLLYALVAFVLAALIFIQAGVVQRSRRIA